MKITGSSRSSGGENLFKQLSAVEQQKASQPNLSNQYHKAAVNGYLDMLCDASKRDTNLAREDLVGFTPTLLAAYNGQLDALRILVGRGGNPEKTIANGSNALHLATLKDHLNCVSFLVNFGINMWALDNNLRTAKDVAALEQRKEILDYLDQMMAKQSAFNTKQVQKLKEKAKIAAEKRLKLMRKAQLKAIKQVEKDERFLIKLSNNRRLLKAAHSLSDIKLVGKPSTNEQALISYSPTTKCSINGGSCMNNFIQNYKLHREIMNNGGRFGNQLINFKNKTSISSSDSAYASSSVSSTSGYLSSASNQSNLFKSSKSSTASTVISSKSQRQPKYSDLVALGRSKNGPIADSQSDLSQQVISKTNGKILNKLKLGIGSGVSRKVHLKRISAINSASSILLNSIGIGKTDDRKSTAELESQFMHQQASTSGIYESGNTNSSKLCNVQPAIRLKLNSDVQPKSALDNNQTVSSESPNSIKWPPAPAMTRAASEPDFNAVFKLDQTDLEEDEEEDVEGEPEVGTRLTELNIIEKLSDRIKTEQETRGEFSSSQKDDGESDEKLTSSNEHPMANCDGGQESKQQQHHLLTKCLTQLKLCHNAMSKRQDNESHAMNRRNAISGAALKQPVAIFSGSSDELIQHQLTAGEFPIRPSIIKQQQLQHHHQANQTTRNSDNLNSSKQFKASEQKQVPDSIGSAASLADRSARSSTSSIETSSLDQKYLQPRATEFSYSSASCLSSESACTRTSTSDSLQSSTPLNNFAASGEHIETFLRTNGLLELQEVFERERIDLEALILLTEEDLKSLDILLGPRRKLMKAIWDRRRLAQVMGPMFVMVDTSL